MGAYATNKKIILFAVFVMGISYLAAYHDNFFHRVYRLCMEVPCVMIIAGFYERYNIRDTITSLFLCSLIAYEVSSLIDSAVCTVQYFYHYNMDYAMAEELFINKTHDNYICWYIAISGLTAIISFFYLTVNKR